MGDVCKCLCLEKSVYLFMRHFHISCSPLTTQIYIENEIWKKVKNLLRPTVMVDAKSTPSYSSGLKPSDFQDKSERGALICVVFDRVRLPLAYVSIIFSTPPMLQTSDLDRYDQIVIISLTITL